MSFFSSRRFGAGGGGLKTIRQRANTYAQMTYNALGELVETIWPVCQLQEGVVDERGRELGYYNSTGRDWWDRDIWAGGGWWHSPMTIRRRRIFCTSTG
jgi:hypothetical protein